jgi:hypothetical protein
MANLPKLAARTIERYGRPGKTITQPGPDRYGSRGSRQKEQFQP